MRPGKFVIVEWEDISSEDDSWVDVKKAVSSLPTIVWSIGWLISTEGEYVRLAMDWCEDQTVHQRGKIPKSVVRKIREVKFRGFPKRKEVPSEPPNTV
jgi:hypothetical protein